MRKIAKVLTCLFVFLLEFRAVANVKHSELRSKYPYGLIGDDYGLLNQEDLAVNTCNTLAITPFSREKNMAYSYWQCFELEHARIECSPVVDDPSEQFGYLEVNAENKLGRQSYLARDAMDLKDCARYVRSWKQKTRGEKYICVSGSYGGFSAVRNGHDETDWVFDKFKTSLGCVSHRSNCHLDRPPGENCILPKGWKHPKRTKPAGASKVLKSGV